LAKAEANLGLLGWQQADFDEDTQRQVDALHNIEREQARLMNLAANLAHQRDAVAAQRAKLRETYEQKRLAIEGERNQVRQPLPDLQRKLSFARDHMPDVERTTSQLDREQRDIEALSNRLLVVQPQPIHIRDEILRLRDRMLGIQNERNDLRIQHARSTSEIHQLDHQIGALEKRSTEIDRQLNVLRNEFEGEDAKLEKEEQAKSEEKGSTESQINALERVKGNPYRAIGRVLADNDIAPMNQPEALSNVLKFRGEISLREAAIETLRAESRAVDYTLLIVSVSLWLVIVIAAGLIASAAV